LTYDKNKHMHTATDPGRNRPAEKGKDHDPDLRDDSAIQPGVSTISTSDSDKQDESKTQTGKDSFRTAADDPYADRDFEEGGEA